MMTHGHAKVLTGSSLVSSRIISCTNAKYMNTLGMSKGRRALGVSLLAPLRSGTAFVRYPWQQRNQVVWAARRGVATKPQTDEILLAGSDGKDDHAASSSRQPNPSQDEDGTGSSQASASPFASSSGDGGGKKSKRPRMNIYAHLIARYGAKAISFYFLHVLVECTCLGLMAFGLYHNFVNVRDPS